MPSRTGTFKERTSKALGSLKFSFVLLVLLGLLIAQRALIAQKFIYVEDPPWFLRALNALGLGSIKHLDGPLYIVLALFVINLGFSSIRMARRIKAKQRGIGGYKGEEGIRALTNSVVFQAPEGSAPAVERFLKGRGLRTTVEHSGQETRIHGRKRRMGYWGVFFFHLTFLVVLVGAILSVLTRHAGYFEISPGETFVEKRENYKVTSKKPMLFGEDREFQIRLEQIDLAYWRPGASKRMASVVSVYDSEGAFIGRKMVEINSPLRMGKTSIYQGIRHGYIAGLKVSDSVGTVAPGTARFRIPLKPGGRMTSKVHLPGTTLDLKLELFTEKLGDIEGLEQYGPQHMATLIKVTSVEEGYHMFRGVVFLGWESLSFEGLTIEFLHLKPYTSFLVVRDYGIPVIFSGLVLLLFGLVVTYFWVPENYWAVIKKQDGGDSIVVGAMAEKFKGSFRERFMAEMEELKKEISGR